MKTQVIDLDGKKVGEIELSEAVFGRPKRADIVARMVRYQQAKKRQGTHDTKLIGEISGTGKKPYAQKGTGQARQGSLRSPQFRGGAVMFGPTPRSHAHDLTKGVRKLALCTALSAKAADGKLIVLDSAKTDSHKTKAMLAKLKKLNIKSALIIDGANPDANFCRAVANVPLIDVLPEQGANVYDIIRRDVLVLTRNAVEQLEARLK
jgi:large subunit ribosomal protein L4